MGNQWISDVPELNGSAALQPLDTRNRFDIECPASDTAGCTGPYRQHRSAGRAFNFISARVNLPCSETHLVEPEQSAYEYLAHFDSAHEEIETGLEFDTIPPNSSGFVSSVTPYLSGGGNGFTQLGIHLDCDQAGVVLESHISQRSADSPRMLVYSVQGTTTDGGCNFRNCKTTFVSNVDMGFNQLCPGCSTGYTTAIAVAGGSQIFAKSLSYFGVSNAVPSCETGMSPQPAVSWSSVTNGTYASFGNNAQIKIMPFQDFRVINDPPNGPALGEILSVGSGSNETNGINAYGPVVCSR